MWRIFLPSLIACACACASSSRTTIDVDQLARSIDALRAQIVSQDAKLEALQGRVDILAASGGPRERTAMRDTRELEVVKLTPPSAGNSAAMHEDDDEPVMLEITGEGDKLQIVKMPPAPKHKGAPTVVKNAPNITTAKADDATFSEALQLYRDGKADEAFVRFADVVKKTPKSDKAATALYWMGEVRFESLRYSDAIEQYKRLVDGYPMSGKSAEAMLKIGICYEKLNDPSRARDAFQRLVDEHPQSAVAELALARPGVTKK